MELLDFCAKHDFDGIDPTGYFFPGYPEVPTDEFVNDFKRRAFEPRARHQRHRRAEQLHDLRQGRCATPSVKHIKEWVEVAARLGAPVLRVFADTQMKAMTWQDVAKGCTRDDVQKCIVEALNECTEHGKKYGVIIGVQNHGDFLQTADQLLALVKRRQLRLVRPDRRHRLLQDARPVQRHRPGRAVRGELADQGDARSAQENDSADRPGQADEDHPRVRLPRYLPIETLSKNKGADATTRSPSCRRS